MSTLWVKENHMVLELVLIIQHGSGQNTPIGLTNASTLWNSDNQKVIYMSISGGRYPTSAFHN